MNGKSIGVAAALLVGGGTFYGGYQVLDGRDGGADADLADVRSDAPSLPDPRQELTAAETDVAGSNERGRSGVPGGTAALDFGGGAPGDDLTDAARRRADEAQNEADRLAMLGTGDIDLSRAPGADAVGDASVGGGANAAQRARGLRDTASPDAAGSDARRDTDSADVERLLAEIAARSEGTVPASADAEEGYAADATSPNANTGRFASNRPMTDKPDQGGFTANRRLTDKPDQGGYVASADTQRFDPCEKADGTAYKGPGTALNPFAETDPCLPQATAQGYQVAQAASLPPTTDLTAQALQLPAGLVAVDVARPSVPPPPPVGTGSDYRG